MRIAPLAEVKDHFSRYIERIQNGPIIVTKNGRPAAVLVCIPENEEDLERFLLAYNPKFQNIIEPAYWRIQKTGGIKNKEFWKKSKRQRKRFIKDINTLPLDVSLDSLRRTRV